MRAAITALVAAALVASTSAPAFAQDTGSSGARCADAVDSEHTYCFGEENVGAGVVGPNGQGSRLLRAMHGPSLLRIRAHFVPEMLKSVENL